jgi:hypothetical protein
MRNLQEEIQRSKKLMGLSLLDEGAYRPEQLSKSFDKWVKKESEKSAKEEVAENIKLWEKHGGLSSSKEYLYNLHYTNNLENFNTLYKEDYIKFYPYFKNRDIFKMRYYDLRDEIISAQKLKEMKDLQTAKEGIDYETIYSDSKIKIVVPLTLPGSCKYSQGAQWCTAMISHPYLFTKYRNEGILFRILFLGGDYKISLHYSFDGGKIYRGPKDNYIDTKDVELPKEAEQAIESYYQEHKK